MAIYNLNKDLQLHHNKYLQGYIQADYRCTELFQKTNSHGLSCSWNLLSSEAPDYSAVFYTGINQ